LATLELNAAVQGELDAGASGIWAWDGHCGFPGGLDIELVHPDCRLAMAACREVESLIPGTATTCVKEGLTPESLHAGQAPTLTMSPVKARERIQDDVTSALLRVDRPAPFRVDTPFDIRTQFANDKLADRVVKQHDDLTRLDETTVAFEGDAFMLVL